MRKIEIRNERVRVEAKFHEEGSVLKGDKQGFCDGFEIIFSLESDEPVQVIEELIELSHRMCFTEVALKNTVPLTFTHMLNGQAI